MPIQIDRMETAIEILPAMASRGQERRTPDPAAAADPLTRRAVRDMIGAVIAEEFDTFMRGRGL